MAHSILRAVERWCVDERITKFLVFYACFGGLRVSVAFAKIRKPTKRNEHEN